MFTKYESIDFCMTLNVIRDQNRQRNFNSVNTMCTFVKWQVGNFVGVFIRKYISK